MAEENEKELAEATAYLKAEGEVEDLGRDIADFKEKVKQKKLQNVQLLLISKFIDEI